MAKEKERTKPTIATSNMTSIGASAINTSGANTMQLGSTAVTDIWCAAGAAVVHSSDGRFKTNVTTIPSALAFINKLRPVTYNMNTQAWDDFDIQGMTDSAKTAHKAGLNFAPSMAITHSGFIAQEVAQAAQQTGFTSSIVSVPTNPNTQHYGIAYDEMVVPLVKAVQELSKKDSLHTVAHQQDSAKISKQDSVIAAIQNQLNQLAGTGNRTIQNNGINPANSGTNSSNPANANSINNINVQLSNANVVVLNQNQPNPFAEQTLITYNIPSTANAAQILFYDVNGKQINSVTITTFGAGQLNVFANDLSSGVYSYTLIVDGQVIDTKKMVKQ